MTEALLEVATFGAKAFVVAFFLGLSAAATLLFMPRRRPPSDDDGVLFVTRLDLRYRDMSDAIRRLGLTRKEVKALEAERDAADDADEKKARVFVMSFEGDVTASPVNDLRRVVTAVVGAANEGDSVVVEVTSPGGTVPGYGLAAAQLQRLRDAGLHVTVAVDKVAASGGYMMAVVSDELVAAPFAILGSIGVYLPVPNVNRLLNDHGVEFKELTSGKYKRTVSLLGELTDEGVEKTQQMLDETHALFKRHVGAHRDVDIEAVATGEYWYGTQALALGLVDRIATSDEVLLERAREANLVRVSIQRDDKIARRVLGVLGRLPRLFG